ncbi:acyltransferase [Pseudomonas chlororaphis]|uniref:acyltransferase family protein n=1 Tax=Pseudomonas chlororaphis TaxID=587753 RepID=UPI00209B83A4|nr:acyltransferase [Pseudomonas chlororaphis]MCO7570115.1 acyltransferase [Pseudomonas chlororaphis]MCO7587262.1 acyltransferase [Pseudomonas chlororaphis]
MDGNEHRNNFDLIRLLAALQVAFSHTFWWLQVPLPREVEGLLKCFPGVPVFFVVSGFLITRSYVSRQRGLLGYFGSRALRIYPALWLQYLLVIVLMACTGGFALATLLDPIFWKWLLSAMFLGSNFWGNLVTNYSPFTWDGLYRGYPSDVLWTIPVELGFYLLVPLVFSKTLARLRLTPWFIVLCFALSLAAAMQFGPMLRSEPRSNVTGMLLSNPAPYFWLFLAGATVANYWQRLQFFFVGRASWWLLVFASINLLYYVQTGATTLDYRVPDPVIALRAMLLAGFVLALAHSWPQLSSWMRGRDLSYGLYLFHMPLPLGLYSAGITGQAWMAWASLLFAFVLAAASWTWVESPCLSLRSRLGTNEKRWRLARLTSVDLRPLRPVLPGVAALAVVGLVTLGVTRSTLLDQHGQQALEQFFGTDSGVLVQPYQAPNLLLHRGMLHISGDNQPAGLGLVVEATQQGSRKLELVGQQQGSQAVSGRLTIDDGASTYFRMPNGPLSITVAAGTRVELLIYADLPYTYQIEEVSLKPCPKCTTDVQMVTRITQEIPALDLPPEAASQESRLVAAAQLMHWLSPQLVIEGDQAQYAVMSGLQRGQILTDLFDAKRYGAACGGFAVFQPQLCRQIDQVRLIVDHLCPRLKQHGIKGRDIWLDLLKKGVIAITSTDAVTRDALLKALKTHNVAFSGEQ